MQSKGLSPALQFKSISSLALSLLNGPSLISIHGWKNHSFDNMDHVVKVSLCFLILSSLVLAFFPRSKHLLISSLHILSVCEKKKTKKRPQLKTFVRPEGKAPIPASVESSEKKENTSSFQPKTQPMKSHGLFIIFLPNLFSCLCHKIVLLILPCGDLKLTCHCCRPSIAILCWSWISPSVLEKYLVPYLFQLSKVLDCMSVVEQCIILIKFKGSFSVTNVFVWPSCYLF